MSWPPLEQAFWDDDRRRHRRLRAREHPRRHGGLAGASGAAAGGDAAGHAADPQLRASSGSPACTRRPRSPRTPGMPTAAFADFLYGACLRDWDAEGKRMQRIADRFDAADDVQIVGVDTDISFSLAGRHGEVDAGDANMPAGEVFYSPVEDSANGVITFGEYPGGTAATSPRHPVPLRGRSASSRPRPRAPRTSCSRRSTPTRARAGWASSASAATRASTAHTATLSSTRRSTGRSTSRSAPASRSSAARTRVPSTGTSSRS